MYDFLAKWPKIFHIIKNREIQSEKRARFSIFQGDFENV
jgi:hypothetical protein